MKKIAVLIPCYNEEKGIANVINSIPKAKLKALGYTTEVIVVDNNSKDNTVKIAKKNKAVVIVEKKQGKGNAVITGFKSISKDTDIIVMLDGDDTYKSSEMIRLIEPLDSNFCDVVIGTRLGGRMSKESMSEFNRLGNWLFTFLVRSFYHGNVMDVCTGYFAWKREVIENITPYLVSNGFSIEMEMITKIARMKYDIYSVPITYDTRSGDSSLNPISDGIQILNAWAKNLRWSPHYNKIEEDESTANSPTAMASESKSIANEA